MPHTEIPRKDFYEYLDLTQDNDLDEALERLIIGIETHYFMAWALVERHEAGQALSVTEQELLHEWQQEHAVRDDRILYINGQARPSLPWHEIAQNLAPRLLLEPFRTAASPECWAVHEGWQTLLEVLQQYQDELPLPLGVDEPLEIFSEDLRHRLNLQACFSELGGLGFEDNPGLDDESEQERIDWFIRLLRNHRDTVRYFDLTLNTLLTRLVLPAQDQALFIQLFSAALALTDPDAPLLNFL